MTISIFKNSTQLLKDTAEKIFLEAPEYFTNAIAVTNKNFIYTSNTDLYQIKTFAQKILESYFERNSFGDGATNVLNLNKAKEGEEEKNLPFIIFGCKEGKNHYNEKITKEQMLFNFFHETMHVIAIASKTHTKDNHFNESFADAGAYLLYIREVGEDAFIRNQPFSRAELIVSDILYNEKGSYYTTESLLAARRVTEEIDVKKLHLKDIVEIAKTIADEFYIPQEQRDFLYDSLIEKSEEENILENFAFTTDKNIYRTGRQISLSDVFQKEAGMAEAEKFFQKRDVEIGFILDPIEAKDSAKQHSNTLTLIKSF